jgi:hypothetical protein
MSHVIGLTSYIFVFLNIPPRLSLGHGVVGEGAGSEFRSRRIDLGNIYILDATAA